MMHILDAIIGRPRAVLSITTVLAFAGLYFYFTIPREASPAIDPPVFVITIGQEGIPVEDAERLLIKPVEGVLRGLEGLKELTAIASPGRASLVAEFDIGADRGKVYAALRERIAAARAALPAAAFEPVVEETSLSLPPAMIVGLSGNVPERTLQRFARKLKDRIEKVPNVLRADLGGGRAEVLEVIIDPAKLQFHGVSEAELVALGTQNSRSLAGNLATGDGRVSLKAEQFDSEKDILSLPVKVSAQGVVTLRDVGELRRTFKDATGFSRINGRPAIVLQVVKRPGANMVETNRAIRHEVENATDGLPGLVKTEVLFDQSRLADEILGSLEGNIVSAVVLVMVVLTVGMRSPVLVGLSIPLSFLIGFAGLALTGVTLNCMVMFGLALTAGVVVHGAIGMVDYAGRELARGVSRADAYRRAAGHMFWPVITTTAIAFAVYVPMLFWPGVAGKFMAPMPITVIYVLAASVFTTLVALPVLGALGAGELSKLWPGVEHRKGQKLAALKGPSVAIAGALPGPATGGPAPLTPIPDLAGPPAPGSEAATSAFMSWYTDLLQRAISHPVTVLSVTGGLTVAVLIAFRLFGQGAEFFVDTEPEAAVVTVAGRGNMSAKEQLELVESVEAELLEIGGLRTVLTVSGSARQSGPGRSSNTRMDQIGQITVEFEDTGKRREGRKLLEEIRLRTSGVPGVQVEVRKRELGPPVGKSLRLEVSSDDRETAIAAAAVIRRHLDEDRQLRDIEDTRPLPGIEWNLTVDREEAGRFGADIRSVGAAIQMIANGVLVGKYRPPDADEEIDIRARFPIDERSVGQLDQLTMRTPLGVVPMSNFVERKPQPQAGERVRVNWLHAMTIAANTADGVHGAAKRAETVRWIQQQEWPEGIGFRFRGAVEDEREASTFLKQAMIGALFLIFVILVARYDSFYQTAITLMIVPLSLIGVLIGMLLTGQTFSVMMTGTGILVLTGVVVGNAITLINTYNLHRGAGTDAITAIMQSSAERLRPALLTASTAIIGLAPMALRWNIDIFGLGLGSSSVTSAWWVQFATAMIFGLAFSTVLTLLLVPALLAAPTVLSARWRHAKAEPMARVLDQHKLVSRASRLLKQYGPRQQP